MDLSYKPDMRVELTSDFAVDWVRAKTRTYSVIGWLIGVFCGWTALGRISEGDVASSVFFACITLLALPPLWRDGRGSMPLWLRVSLGVLFFGMGLALSSGSSDRREFARRCIELGGEPARCHSNQAWEDYVNASVAYERSREH